MWKILQNRIYILHICKCLGLSMHFASCEASEVSLDAVTGSKEYEFVNEAPSFYGVSGIGKRNWSVSSHHFQMLCLTVNELNHCTAFCHIIICEKAKPHFNKCERSIAVQLSWCLPVFNITGRRWIQTPLTFKDACWRWIIKLFVSQLLWKLFCEQINFLIQLSNSSMVW